MTAMPASPAIVAHRGASNDCPENTQAAFEEALRRGADAIELDVQLSRDGVPVVYHDRTLTRAGGGRRQLSALDWSELRELDPGLRFDRRFRGQTLPSLEQVLDRFAKRTRLLIEIKTREGRRGAARHVELAQSCARLVRRRRLERRISFLCFDESLLAAAAEVAPRAQLALNLKPPRRMTEPTRRRLTGLHAASADVRTLTPAFGQAVLDAGLELFAFTCNTPQRVQRALEAGATAIMSDKPAWLATQLERRR